MYETESNVLILKDLFKMLDDDIAPVLYTYDSILFDLPKEKYNKLQSILHKVVPKEFPFKLKSGTNYKDLQ